MWLDSIFVAFDSMHNVLPELCDASFLTGLPLDTAGQKPRLNVFKQHQKSQSCMSFLTALYQIHSVDDHQFAQDGCNCSPVCNFKAFLACQFCPKWIQLQPHAQNESCLLAC